MEEIEQQMKGQTGEQPKGRTDVKAERWTQRQIYIQMDKQIGKTYEYRWTDRGYRADE